MPDLPKAAAKALKVTKGKMVMSGAVFVDGKYLEPPYVVERYGVGIRINKVPVTGEVIQWDDFLRTQEGARVIAPEKPKASASNAPALPSVPPPSLTAAQKEGDDSLDDLFEDDPKPKKKTSAQKSASTSGSASTVVAKMPTVEFDGEFKANDSTRAMVKKINSVRTEIDGQLRQGSLLCFGSGYSRVTGDRRTLMQFLEKMPEIQKECSSVEDFKARTRAAGLVYLGETLCEELYRNRVDYRRLQERRQKIADEQKYDKMLNGVQ